MADPTYTIDRKALAYLLYGKVPTSDIVPIYIDLRRRAESVERRARVLVGKRTGALAASIGVSDYRVPNGWHFRVMADNRVAMWHHRGTKPHVIKGPVTFPAGGKMITAARVAHPGTRPNPFLRNALPAFMAARDNPALLR